MATIRTEARSAPLPDSVLLRGLAPADLRAVVRKASRVRTPKGSWLFHQGDPAAAMYMMVSGKVKLTLVHPDGQEVIVQVIGPGDAFGAVAAFGGARYPVSAEAGEAVEALEWDGAISAQLFMKYPALAVNALRIVAARMQEVQARLSEQVADRVEQRLAQALLRLVGHAGRAVEGGVLLDLPLTRRDLAALAGTTLYTASRVLSRWRSLGLVAGGRKRVVVRDPHRLAALAAGEQPDGRASATAKPERS